ncbi:hypothetical protein NDU88_008115 [Pleurodeles waltl]|uniref:Uncharacterized protein n=1 Tax=Pleurodeles waltl TaxID=8319 RepID=A0AAV7U2F0_PLEWA|nr:hypothetical protein NDU88_008115 [Pleurodeles waltl]
MPQGTSLTHKHGLGPHWHMGPVHLRADPGDRFLLRGGLRMVRTAGVHLPPGVGGPNMDVNTARAARPSIKHNCPKHPDKELIKSVNSQSHGPESHQARGRSSVDDQTQRASCHFTRPRRQLPQVSVFPQKPRITPLVTDHHWTGDHQETLLTRGVTRSEDFLPQHSSIKAPRSRRKAVSCAVHLEPTEEQRLEVYAL